MQYIKADAAHAEAVAALAHLLWGDADIDDLRRDFAGVVRSGESAVFLCMDGCESVAFAQFGLRHDYVEGTDARPAGYLEGIFVKNEYRRQGVAQGLIRLGERWAREKGCSQMASDCELTNTDSLAFHLGCGFAEVNRIICFVKDIGTNPGSET